MKRTPRVLIAGIASGNGKTTTVCALLQLLLEKNYKLAVCKCGPDYIDPMFHRSTTHADTANLDLFFLDKERVNALLKEIGEKADITVIEGVMGFYDGRELGRDEASSYDIAKKTNTPVILTLYCKGMSLSSAAVINGIINFRQDSNIRGVILNGITRELYIRMKPVIENETKVSVVGFIPPLKQFNLESRHLGLVTPDEISNLNEQLLYLKSMTKDTINIEKIVEIANQAGEIAQDSVMQEKELGKVRIAYALDKAFCFYYEENLSILRQLGAQLIPFSPLEDEALPENIDGLILGGGYPELYVDRLSKNESMKKEIKNAIQQGIPCVAECGGFMYLHERLQGQNKEMYPMVGVIQGECYKKDRLVRFGYVELEAKHDTKFLPKGEKMKAHEFHYWDSTNNGSDFQAVKVSTNKEYETIHVWNNLFAGYPHLYYLNNRSFPRNFVTLCIEYKNTRERR